MMKIKIFYKNKKERIYKYLDWVIKLQALSGICAVCVGIFYYIMSCISINNFLTATSMFSITMVFVALIIVAID